jgi:pantothenate kinase
LVRAAPVARGARRHQRVEVLEELIERAAALGSDGRAILGIAGSPGAGKSTLAGLLLGWLTDARISVGHVPMDGFHLADAVLDQAGRRGRKGAIDTFDAHGYLAKLRRLRAELDHTVYAPAFERVLEQPIAGAIPIVADVRLVITEGDYLLADVEPWPAVRDALDEVWFVEIDDAVRRERLIQRHIEFGKDPIHARAWVDDVDEPNARLIETGRERADLVIDLARISPGPYR